jgi:hypothetical protein
MYSFGESKKIVNGKIVQDVAVKSEYDGKTLHVDKVENNKFTHFKKLLGKKISKLGLLERLSKEYMSSKTKRNKHKRSNHKRSKHKRSKHKRSNHKQKHKHTKKKRF